MYGAQTYSERPYSALPASGLASYVYAGSGGLVFAGAAALARLRAYTPAGGITFSGAAQPSRDRAWSPSGGLTFAGAAPVAQVRAWLASGSIVFDGSGGAVFEPGLPPEPRKKEFGQVAVWPGRVPPGERRRHDDDDEFLLLI